ncbi:MAG: hypothetical protein QOH46_162, partial [Solirubrobacteraceae bacterium]|nr:hypothetical protein [Solirubrobacteraceae bacterium]
MREDGPATVRPAPPLVRDRSPVALAGATLGALLRGTMVRATTTAVMTQMAAVALAFPAFARGEPPVATAPGGGGGRCGPEAVGAIGEHDDPGPGRSRGRPRTVDRPPHAGCCAKNAE